MSDPNSDIDAGWNDEEFIILYQKFECFGTPEPEEFQHPIQYDPLGDNFDDNSSTSSESGDSVMQQFAKDVSGHYKNPKFGIVDFIIPDGWYGSERQWSGDESISLDLHPGTEAEFLDTLLENRLVDSASNDDVFLMMMLESNDKKQLQIQEDSYPICLRQAVIASLLSIILPLR
jgi:hypothetical protein